MPNHIHILGEISTNSGFVGAGRDLPLQNVTKIKSIP